MSGSSEPGRPRRSRHGSPASSASASASHKGGGGGGGGGGLPTGIRRVGRHQKVRLWLSTFCDGRSLSASAPSAPSAGPDSNSLITWRRWGQRGAGAPTAWCAFDDSGTFSAESAVCADSQQPRSRCSTARSSLLLRRASVINPRSPRSSTSNLSAKGSAQTSLNRLLQNRLNLLSCSTPSPQLGESYSVKSATAEWLRHNSEQLTTASGGGGGGGGGGGKRSRSTKRSGGSEPKTSASAQSKPSAKSAKPSAAVQVVKPSVASSDIEEGGGGGGGGGSSAFSSLSTSEDLVRHPEPYHVRILPAMCYLVWRPNMLRRECLMERGQTAYLNALQPSSMPMQFLIAAVAARLDIQVPLLDSLRPEYSTRVPKFEYVLRWHTPNGQRIQLSDRITDIDHPAGQSGDPASPVRVFIAGSPGWLTKAK